MMHKYHILALIDEFNYRDGYSVDKNEYTVDI